MAIIFRHGGTYTQELSARIRARHERARREHDVTERTVEADDGAGAYLFRTASDAASARRAIAARAPGEACPRVVGCSCGAGAYQERWGQTIYCQGCGGLL